MSSILIRKADGRTAPQTILAKTDNADLKPFYDPSSPTIDFEARCEAIELMLPEGANPQAMASTTKSQPGLLPLGPRTGVFYHPSKLPDQDRSSRIRAKSNHAMHCERGKPRNAKSPLSKLMTKDLHCAGVVVKSHLTAHILFSSALEATRTTMRPAIAENGSVTRSEHGTFDGYTPSVSLSALRALLFIRAAWCYADGDWL